MAPISFAAFRMGGVHLYVGRGIGTPFTPVRLNAPPETTLVLLS